MSSSLTSGGGTSERRSTGRHGELREDLENRDGLGNGPITLFDRRPRALMPESFGGADEQTQDENGNQRGDDLHGKSEPEDRGAGRAGYRGERKETDDLKAQQPRERPGDRRRSSQPSVEKGAGRGDQEADESCKTEGKMGVGGRRRLMMDRGGRARVQGKVREAVPEHQSGHCDASEGRAAAQRTDGLHA